ncbi:MAG: hypothetical protein H6622_00790 [Halobacteriovoraceae bacterium]|nr:hypothetical protein [Halobacteriovoraceae bacterium]
MRLKLKDVAYSLSITILLLVVIEVLTSALFPMLGLVNFRMPVNILIILYIALKVESPYTALFVFLIQICHSVFSIETWALGTTAGVIICMVIEYLRYMIHLTSAVVTVMVAFFFQMAWFVIVSFLVYLKNKDWSYVSSQAWNFLPESIILAILAPLFFLLLDKIWTGRDEGLLAG